MPCRARWNTHNTHRIDDFCIHSNQAVVSSETIGTYCLGPSKFSSLAGCVSWMPEISRALGRKVPNFHSGTVLFVSVVALGAQKQ